MEEKNKGGRPTIFTKELGDKLCEELSLGKSMRKICEDEDMPCLSSVFKWIRENPEFSQQYALAKEASADADNEVLEDIGDKAIEEAKAVDPKSSSAVVQAYKLKADNLKWFMSKKKPKKYGDKVDVTSGGEVIKGNTIILKDFDETGSK